MFKLKILMSVFAFNLKRNIFYSSCFSENLVIPKLLSSMTFKKAWPKLN